MEKTDEDWEKMKKEVGNRFKKGFCKVYFSLQRMQKRREEYNKSFYRFIKKIFGVKNA